VFVPLHVHEPNLARKCMASIAVARDADMGFVRTAQWAGTVCAGTAILDGTVHFF